MRGMALLPGSTNQFNTSAYIPPYSVCAIILDGEGNVLGITRRGKDDDFGLVGGKIDPTDANPAEACAREIREEVGIEVKPEDLVHVYTRHDNSPEEWKVCWCYFVRAYSGRPRAIENGFKVRWVPWEHITRAESTFGVYNQALVAHLEKYPLPANVSERRP